jgi:hypothetical protein
MNKVHDIKTFSYAGFKYWIHKTTNTGDNWLFTNFDFNITNLNLNTKCLSEAKRKAMQTLGKKKETTDYKGIKGIITDLKRDFILSKYVNPRKINKGSV